MKTRIMISAAVIAAGMLASCSNKEIVDEQPEIDGVSASVLNIVPTVGTDTRAGFVPKTEWAVNDAMGLFMYKATGWGDAYPRYDAQNNKSTKQRPDGARQNPSIFFRTRRRYGRITHTTRPSLTVPKSPFPSMREPLSTTCGERAQTRCRSLKRMPSFP